MPNTPHANDSISSLMTFHFCTLDGNSKINYGVMIGNGGIAILQFNSMTGVNTKYYRTVGHSVSFVCGDNSTYSTGGSPYATLIKGGSILGF